MSLFSKKSTEASVHRVHIHFAQPLTERLRKDHEADLLTQWLPKHKATGSIAGSWTTLSNEDEPTSSDIQLEISTADPAKLFRELLRLLEARGLGRGSWLVVDGERTDVGNSEYVLLRTKLAAESDSYLEPTVKALQHALGDGDIGWHEDVYYRHDGPVFVYNGASGAAIIRTLEAELVKHPLLRRAELASATPRE